VLGGSGTESLEEIFSSLKRTMSNLETTSEDLNSVIGDNSGKLTEIFDNVESITSNLKNSNEALSNAIKNAEMITDSLAKLNLAATLEKVDLAMMNFNKIAEDINSGKGTLGQLVQNDSLHTELVTASHDLDLLLNDMRIHPKRYLSFSLINRTPDNEEFSRKELEQMRDEIDKELKKKEKKGD
jgi:phospholipid/cholesterol/gamma-HCH transport system substrate-binding protein